MEKYRYLIDRWDAESIEDDFTDGEVGTATSYWDNSNFGCQPSNGFETIKDALEFVANANCFDFSIDSWMKDDFYVGTFYGDFLVDESNCEVSPNSKRFADWKKGKAKLYNCRVTVKLIAVKIDEQKDEMFENWK